MALIWNRPYEWDVDDWRRRASCRDTEPDLFFPVGTTGSALDQNEAAKAVCRPCQARGGGPRRRRGGGRKAEVVEGVRGGAVPAHS